MSIIRFFVQKSWFRPLLIEKYRAPVVGEPRRRNIPQQTAQKSTCHHTDLDSADDTKARLSLLLLFFQYEVRTVLRRKMLRADVSQDNSQSVALSNSTNKSTVLI